MRKHRERSQRGKSTLASANPKGKGIEGSKIGYEVLKRLLDIIVAMFLLLFFGPLFVVIALFIKFDSKGPVFFCPKMVGKDGKLFKMFKFRTMIDGAITKGTRIETSKNDWRITRVGKWLREWSIDELPQLLNVIKGEMSLVGPRPVFPHVAAKFKEWQKERFKVRPGITGWAQVNGRNSISWEQKLRYDIWYVHNRSLALDLQILLRTVRVVLGREGIYGPDGRVKAFKG